MSIMRSIVILVGLCANAHGYELRPIKLKYSNVFLIKAQKNILVDTGSKGEIEDLIKRLSDMKVKLDDVSLVVLTHAHSDHAANVAEIKHRSKAKVVLQRGDLGFATAGDHGKLRVSSFLGYFLKWFIDPKYEAFTPDFIYDSMYDLIPWGIGGYIMAMPGHTKGSSVIIVDQTKAFVGDMFMGGYFGGAYRPEKPGEYYFSDDIERNKSNIKVLIDMGIETFYVGHGGPVSRSDLVKWITD